MIRILNALLIIAVLFPVASQAQSAAPRKEFRGVWIATVEKRPPTRFAAC